MEKIGKIMNTLKSNAKKVQSSITSDIIDAKHISQSFTSDSGTTQHVLHDISFTLREGEIVAILGRSGAGKSTFLRTMAGLVQPTEGTVTYRGRELTKPQTQELQSYFKPSLLCRGLQYKTMWNLACVLEVLVKKSVLSLL